MSPRRFVSLMAELKTLKPGTRRADGVRHALAELLLRSIIESGSRAPAAIVAALNRAGHAFAMTERVGSLRTWTEEFNQGSRVVELRAGTGRSIKSAHVNYRSRRPLRLTKQQQATKARQDAFYSLYERAGQKAHGSARRGRLTPSESLALLVGELEADVNNGGFEQYLLNKGRRRARTALRGLTAIGAVRTASMLRAALDLPEASPRFDTLDAQFERSGEDLACLSMRSLERKSA